MAVKSGDKATAYTYKGYLSYKIEHCELSILKNDMLTQIHYILTIGFSSCKTLLDYKTACLPMII